LGDVNGVVAGSVFGMCGGEGRTIDGGGVDIDIEAREWGRLLESAQNEVFVTGRCLEPWEIMQQILSSWRIHLTQQPANITTTRLEYG
jgi:hypothetical protein